MRREPAMKTSVSAKFSPTWSASSLLSSLGVPQRGLRIKSNRHASYSYYVRKEPEIEGWSFRVKREKLGAVGTRRLIACWGFSKLQRTHRAVGPSESHLTGNKDAAVYPNKLSNKIKRNCQLYSRHWMFHCLFRTNVLLIDPFKYIFVIQQFLFATLYGVT